MSKARCHKLLPAYKGKKCRMCWDRDSLSTIEYTPLKMTTYTPVGKCSRHRAAIQRAIHMCSFRLDTSEEEELSIQLIYLKAIALEMIDGVKRHVDHIRPMKRDGKGGMHELCNLQILTADENIAKGDKEETHVEYIGGEVIGTLISRRYFNRIARGRD